MTEFGNTLQDLQDHSLTLVNYIRTNNENSSCYSCILIAIFSNTLKI